MKVVPLKDRKSVFRPLLEKVDEMPGQSPRSVQVYVGKEGDIHIETYRLGPRGAKVYGGSSQLTTNEFAEIAARLAEVQKATDTGCSAKGICNA